MTYNVLSGTLSPTHSLYCRLDTDQACLVNVAEFPEEDQKFLMKLNAFTRAR